MADRRVADGGRVSCARICVCAYKVRGVRVDAQEVVWASVEGAMRCVCVCVCRVYLTGCACEVP